MVHELKCWPEYFCAVLAGLKTFEVRKNDRNFGLFDELILKEWEPAIDVNGVVSYAPLNGQYTGRSCRVMVAYLLDGIFFEGIEHGFVVMAVRLMQ